MKFGVNTFIWSATFDQSNLTCCPRSNRQVLMESRSRCFGRRQFQASSIRKAIEAHGLECNACTVLVDGLSLISDSADIRRRTREHLEDIAKAAAEAGIGIVAGPLYSPVGYLPAGAAPATNGSGRSRAFNPSGYARCPRCYVCH